MKRKKLLKKLGDFLDSDKREACKRQGKLKEILKKLRDKERQLAQKLEDEQDEKKKKRLQKELDIVHAQRIKGISVYKENAKRCS